jgi:hypothetical protein
MPKQVKDDPEEKDLPQKPEEIPESDEESSWSRDQRERSYYYDDAAGYQKYDPDKDDEDEDDLTES